MTSHSILKRRIAYPIVTFQRICAKLFDKETIYGITGFVDINTCEFEKKVEGIDKSAEDGFHEEDPDKRPTSTKYRKINWN